ncbi:hypothetical protein BGZ68_005616 [Mortierella alpina]|nr:hypothetical protein BGZ68_005616 [Mortierella alpina]
MVYNGNEAMRYAQEACACYFEGDIIKHGTHSLYDVDNRQGKIQPVLQVQEQHVLKLLVTLMTKLEQRQERDDVVKQLRVESDQELVEDQVGHLNKARLTLASLDYQFAPATVFCKQMMLAPEVGFAGKLMHNIELHRIQALIPHMDYGSTFGATSEEAEDHLASHPSNQTYRLLFGNRLQHR